MFNFSILDFYKAFDKLYPYPLLISKTIVRTFIFTMTKIFFKRQKKIDQEKNEEFKNKIV